MKKSYSKPEMKGPDAATRSFACSSAQGPGSFFQRQSIMGAARTNLFTEKETGSSGMLVRGSVTNHILRGIGCRAPAGRTGFAAEPKQF
ncbi:MAG: hypothetical protein QNK37_20885 [Acidobacteriota bacterium]|nr:hypothetical protein [Acidobacteriota bacterium]